MGKFETTTEKVLSCAASDAGLLCKVCRDADILTDKTVHELLMISRTKGMRGRPQHRAGTAGICGNSLGGDPRHRRGIHDVRVGRTAFVSCLPLASCRASIRVFRGKHC
jgi:hypothetical protein